MNLRHYAVLVSVLAMPGVASSQDWIKWEAPQRQEVANQAAEPLQETSTEATSPVAMEENSEAQVVAPPSSSASLDKAECDAEVARTYPVNLWAPGLGKKRNELFAACMSRRAEPHRVMEDSPSVRKIECDAEVARSYPVNLWGPGLGKKREELFAACMARPIQSTPNVSAAPPSKAECDAEVARAYPINLWAPGLRQKRKDLFDACMAR
jgi:hypothetical protein